jgi:hypothetical protein
MRVIHTDEKNEVALRPAQPRQGQVSGPFLQWFSILWLKLSQFKPHTKKTT